MNQPCQPTEIISPNEQKFWQEQAARAPQLIKTEIAPVTNNFSNALMPLKIGGIGLGAALGAATFTKHIKGKWKYASGAAAIASAGIGAFMHLVQQNGDTLFEGIVTRADMLANDSALRDKLAHYLSTNVKAEDIQSRGLDRAVADAALIFLDCERPLPAVSNGQRSR